jgi:diguanylate cyclase (GGDEF)-like protein/PAS domain S-box-containing protein
MNNSDKFFSLRKRAEAVLSQYPPLSGTQIEINALIHELDTYRVELELQNDELLSTQQRLQDSRQQYVDLYNLSPVGYCSLNSEGIIVNANDTLGIMLNIPKHLIINKPFTDVVQKSDQDIFYFYRQAFLNNKKSNCCELRLLQKNYKPFWVKIDGAFKSDLTLLTITNISNLKIMEADLMLAAILFEEGEQAIMIASVDKKIIKVNKAFTDITGYSFVEAVGQKTSLLKSDKQDTFFYQQMWEAINNTHYWQGEIWNKHKNGNVYPEWLTIFTKRNPQNEVENYIGVFSDITEQKITETRFHYMAFYDSLTGLANRALLHERLNGSIKQALGKNDCFALMMLDLDNFKVINDSLGHTVGDELLKEMAKRLLSCTRTEDTVARLGGDEFVILLLNIGCNREEAAENAAKVAQKVLNALAQPMTLDNHELCVTVSIGIAIYNDCDTATHLIKHADNALYHAKDLGRNNYQFFTPTMKTIANFRLTMENELRYALEQSQFELYYQPQVDIGDNRISGAEALLRWHHPEKGIISPGIFISIAEETGLIIPIGTWVLKTACLQIAEWNNQEAVVSIDYIAVNVSARQFLQQDFVNLVINTIIETGIKASQLELELTESILIRDIDETLEKLKTLKAFGVRIAIDDFGTGYSSLSYLKSLPLDVLKIDQSFIATVTSDENDAAIVQTIITLAKNLKIRVLAEGVETKEQLEFLRKKDCDGFQGYLRSHPLPVADFLQLLNITNR